MTIETTKTTENPQFVDYFWSLVCEGTWDGADEYGAYHFDVLNDDRRHCVDLPEDVRVVCVWQYRGEIFYATS